jgi:uncharacterized protein (TIGR02271 family)
MVIKPTSQPESVGPAGTPGSRDYMVRSEEQLNVTTERVIRGRARLEKFLVTETKTITVELTHEEVRLVHAGPAGADSREPGSPRNDTVDVDSTDAERWMVLSEEQVVVTKKLVPTERVRLERYSVTEQRDVTEQIRKEEIELDVDDAQPQRVD